MQAVVYEGPGQLSVQNRDVPVPGEGEVLLAVASLGICGSDLLVWEGGLARVKPPVVIGHEFSGVVADANGAAGISIGDRVVVEPLLNCGECAPCLAGDYNVCTRLGLVGIDVDGAAASHVVVPAHRLHSIPDDLPLREAALAEPSAVAIHMVGRSGATAGNSVLVLGGGPIGVLVACVCRARGVTNLVVSEPNPDRRALLEDIGFRTFDPIGHDVSELTAGLPTDGFDVAFELTAVPAAVATAVEATRVHGTILLGGLPASPLPVPIATAVMKELTLIGARVYRSEDFDEAIRLLADKSIPADKLITREVGIENSVSLAYEHLRDSRSDMKILITPGGVT